MVILEKPKLKQYKKQMEEKIAQCLEIDVSKVNVKAGTNEGIGEIGKNEAIEAHAVVLLEEVYE